MDNEVRYVQIEAALLGIKTALAELEGAGVDDAMAALRDAEDQLERELLQLDELLAREEAANLAAMNREYERSVL